MIQRIKFVVLYLAIIQLTTFVATAQSTTVFTSQGQLKVNGKLPTGSFDFIFHLWDGPDVFMNTQLGTNSKTSVPVMSGLFTVDLDFDTLSFVNMEYWIQTCVQEAGTPPLECLNPLKQIRPIPFAAFAANAESSADADLLDGLDSTEFLRRVASCKICMGHADGNGSEPTSSQCFGLNETGLDDDKFLTFSGDVDGNDRFWLWIDCP